VNQAAIIEAYSHLKSLRKHVPGPVHPKYVSEFHEILDLLERGSGASLANFRIPAAQIKPVVTRVRRGGGATYSGEPYCERAFFLMKVDGVLNMFKILMSSGGSTKPAIGFKPPKQPWRQE